MFNNFSFPSLSTTTTFAFKLTPRLIVSTVAGYYCLGYAYEKGVMAQIDKIAMPIMISYLGRGGMAAFMPTFQKYSAWGVRIVSALAAALIYDLCERILTAAWRAIIHCIFPRPPADPLMSELKATFPNPISHDTTRT